MKLRSVFTCAAAAMAFGLFGAQVCSAQSSSEIVGSWTGVLMPLNSSGTMMLQLHLMQTSNGVTGAAMLTSGTMMYSGTANESMSIGPDPAIDINFPSLGEMTLNMTVGYKAAVGNYSLTTKSGTTDGFTSITMVVPRATASISGVYVGLDIHTGTATNYNGASMFILQTGNNLYISAVWNGIQIYNGAGTISGNNISFRLTQDGGPSGQTSIKTGTAVIIGGNISGVTTTHTVDAQDGINTTTYSAFSLAFNMPIGT